VASATCAEGPLELPPPLGLAGAAFAAVTASAWAAVSAAKVAFALARSACAEVTVARTAVRSSTARVSPMSTWSPGATDTVFTVPVVPKDRSAWLLGVAVPVAVSVCSTEPRVCSAAWNARHRAARARRAGARPEHNPDLRDGTRSIYVNHRCHRDLCVDGLSEGLRSPEKLSRSHLPSRHELVGGTSGLRAP
jgi:hypothetical protein